MASSVFCRVLIAGVCCTSLCSALEHAKKTLEAELVKSKDRRLAETTSAGKEQEQQVPPLCLAFSADCPSSPKASADAASDGGSGLGVVAEMELLSSPLAGEACVEEEPWDTEMFGCGLQALVLVIAADGLRRWQSSSSLSSMETAAQLAQEVSVAEAERRLASVPVDKLCLLRAALEGDAALCEAILRKGPAQRFLCARDVWGCMALHAASVTAGPAGARIVSAMLKKGANVNAVDEWDETPLHLAARKGTKEVCELLLAHGARLDLANCSGCSPLLVAGKEGREDMCRFLLGRGAVVGEYADIPPVLKELLGIHQDEDVYDDDAFGNLSGFDSEDDPSSKRLEACRD